MFITVSLEVVIWQLCISPPNSLSFSSAFENLEFPIWELRIPNLRVREERKTGEGKEEKEKAVRGICYMSPFSVAWCFAHRSAVSQQAKQQGTDLSSDEIRSTSFPFLLRNNLCNCLCGIVYTSKYIRKEKLVDPQED